MERKCLALILSVVVLAFGSPARATDSDHWSPPVDGPVVRSYEPPEHRFGPRHLGIDYAVPAGTPVRAAGDGTVAFAGLVGRSRSVALEHPGGRRTTYAYLRRVSVRPGTALRRGDVLGISGGDGPRHQADVVHFGYRVNGQPEDPAQLFQPPPPRISLAPLDRPACRSQPRRGSSPSGYTGRQPGPSRLGIHTPAESIGVRR